MPYRYNPLSPQFDRVEDTSSFIEGPGSSTDNALVRWDGTTGTLVKDSNAILSDAGSLSLAVALPIASGGTAATTALGARTNLGLGTISTQDANNVAITGGSITGITDLAVADGGTGTSSLTANGLIYGNGVSAVGSLAAATDGQIPIGSTGGAPVLGTITAGTGILVSNGAGNITLSLDTPLSVARGGTGATSLTDHGVLVGSGTSAIDALAVGTTGQLLVGSTGADPAFASSANGDFTFTSSTSGATRTLTIEHTSNTASSQSKLAINVAGGTAFDPITTYTVSGVTSWTQGIDNSDSDAYVLSQGTALGTNNVMRVSTAGEINYPLQPAFSAYNSATDANVTGDGTYYTIIFDTEVFDQSSDYNNATGTFTAPITGKYLLFATAQIAGVTAAMTVGDFWITTSNRTYGNNPCGPNKVFDVNTNYTSFNHALADMDAADTAIVQLALFNGTKVADVGGGTSQTFFMGKLSA